MSDHTEPFFIVRTFDAERGEWLVVYAGTAEECNARVAELSALHGDATFYVTRRYRPLAKTQRFA